LVNFSAKEGKNGIMTNIDAKKKKKRVLLGKSFVKWSCNRRVYRSGIILQYFKEIKPLFVPLYMYTDKGHGMISQSRGSV